MKASVTKGGASRGAPAYDRVRTTRFLLPGQTDHCLLANAKSIGNVMRNSAKISYTNGDGAEVNAELYSDEGYALMSKLWIKVTAQQRRQYEISWLGVPTIQFPEDVVLLQELIWRLRPDVIVECGIAHGGSLLLYATICEVIGHGKIVGVDVEIRKYNRVAIQAHPLADRIKLIEGSSIDPDTVAQVEAHCRGAGRVLVLLDSNHSRDHVAQELEAYSRLVTPGSYLVAMDGAQALVHDIPAGKPEWKNDNPLAAIHDFVGRREDFEIDQHFNRLGATSNIDGFLYRKPIQALVGELLPAS
ncbi:MAG: CmcI family methyltransferase [Proteobacteria bacterium]|nr:CmcI family methyltransferase [Pseudomonadota bacterium]